MANIKDSIKESGQKIKNVFEGEAKKAAGQSRGIFENLFNTFKKQIPSDFSKIQVSKPVATKRGDIVVSPIVPASTVITKSGKKNFVSDFLKKKVFGIPIIGVGAIGLIYFLIKRTRR